MKPCLSRSRIVRLLIRASSSLEILPVKKRLYIKNVDITVKISLHQSGMQNDKNEQKITNHHKRAPKAMPWHATGGVTSRSGQGSQSVATRGPPGAVNQRVRMRVTKEMAWGLGGPGLGCMQQPHRCNTRIIYGACARGGWTKEVAWFPRYVFALYC